MYYICDLPACSPLGGHEIIFNNVVVNKVGNMDQQSKNYASMLKIKNEWGMKLNICYRKHSILKHLLSFLTVYTFIMLDTTHRIGIAVRIEIVNVQNYFSFYSNHWATFHLQLVSISFLILNFFA